MVVATKSWRLEQQGRANHAIIERVRSHSTKRDIQVVNGTEVFLVASGSKRGHMLIADSALDRPLALASPKKSLIVDYDNNVWLSCPARLKIIEDGRRTTSCCVHIAYCAVGLQVPPAPTPDTLCRAKFEHEHTNGTTNGTFGGYLGSAARQIERALQAGGNARTARSPPRIESPERLIPSHGTIVVTIM